MDQIRKLAKAQDKSSGKEEEDAIRHLFQQLGVLLVKGNALCTVGLENQASSIYLSRV